ncbi:MAG: Sir2 silent information regulator family NAD-dependent deacetylase [Treponema sp.]|nr:Sir2 silent information regulator family NAD-dependent deacetylase [Treponema sp.]
MSGIEKIKSVLENAEALVVGAGAGLSTSAGFTYSGERFEQYFSDFRARYGFSDMYTGGFYPYKTLEEHWAYWSRYIMINRYMDAPIPVYEELFELVRNKNYFVITTNVDHCFQKAGFDKSRLFYTQGDYGLFQCSEPCHKKTYDNEEQIRAMYEAEQDMKIPTELLPKCPVCGKPMSMNLRADDTFVEDEGWHRAALRYQDFLNGNKNKNIVYLELGVGGNTPGIIKYPFWNMTYSNPKAKYICINKGEAVVPKEIENQSICVDNDIWAVLRELVPQEKRKQ